MTPSIRSPQNHYNYHVHRSLRSDGARFNLHPMLEKSFERKKGKLLVATMWHTLAHWLICHPRKTPLNSPLTDVLGRGRQGNSEGWVPFTSPWEINPEEPVRTEKNHTRSVEEAWRWWCLSTCNVAELSLFLTLLLLLQAKPKAVWISQYMFTL